MNSPWRNLAGFLALGLLANVLGAGQTLADTARKNQAEKQKDPAAKPVAKKVYTDEDMPSTSSGASSPEPNTSSTKKTEASPATASGGSGEAKWTAEQWKSAIGGMKAKIAAFQTELDQAQKNPGVYASSGDYCYIDNKLVSCVEYNEALKRNQTAIERGRRQLEEGKQKLADMQERCRKAGFGSSVYD